VKSLWLRLAVNGKETMNESARGGDGADNAVFRELCDHVNVVDVDIGVIRNAHSLLNGAIELINCTIDCYKKGIDGLKQVRIASDHHSRPRSRYRHFGIQGCEIAAERRQKGELTGDHS